MSLATKDSHFIFNETLYTQIEGVTLGSPSGPPLAKTFSVYHEKKWLERCLLEYRPFYYRRYVDNIFVLFNSPEYLKRFQSYLNSCHVNICFIIENENDNRISFLDVDITCEQGKFTASVYRKPTFSGIYIHFYSFLPSTYNIGMIHTLVFRCFGNCSCWTKFHLELVELMDVSKDNGYPENFIKYCFKEFLDNKHRMQEKMITVAKKHCPSLSWTIIIASKNQVKKIS